MHPPSDRRRASAAIAIAIALSAIALAAFARAEQRQTVVGENRAGGNGDIGVSAVASPHPDGDTLRMGFAHRA